MCLSVTPRISGTPCPMVMKFYMRNLLIIWKISTEKNFGKSKKKFHEFFFSNLLIMESTNTTEASLILDLDTNPKSSQIYNSVMERKHNKSNKVGVKQCYIFAIYGPKSCKN